MKNNTTWFSIVLALGFTLLLSFTGIYLIEYMVPFARNISWIENSSKAFYQSYWAVEESIYRTYEWGVWFEPPVNPLAAASPVDNAYSVTSLWNVIPEVWRGSSFLNNNLNIISQNIGVNLFVGNNAFSSLPRNLRAEFSVPDFDGDSSPDSLQTSTDRLLWQLSDGQLSLTSRDLVGWDETLTNLFTNNANSQWYMLDGSTQYFSQFYASNCITKDCVLRFSVVNPLISSDGWTMPYLHYRIVGSSNIPFQESYISAQWKSYGFKKDLEVVIPRPATNSAFDFTVLQ